MAGKDIRPNILFIMTDQQRFDCIGCNGNNMISTPNLDRLAGQSANFSSFFVQSPVCVPSRQTFFTGRYPRYHKNRVNYTEMNPDVTLIQRLLQKEGYATGFVGKLHYFPPTAEYAASTGFDYGLLHDAGPTDEYSDYVKWLDCQGAMPESGDYRECRKDTGNPYITVIEEKFHETAWCGLKSREMLGKLAAQDKPFFLFSSFWKPHSPFELPEPWASMYDDCEIELPKRVSDEYINELQPPMRELALRDGEGYHKTPDEDIMWKYRAYYGAVSQIDHEVGLMLQKLDECGLDESTVVVFCSDHGDMMHSHGMIDKNVFYDEAIHTPFMIRYPGTIEPGGYDELVESTDVLPTLFELCGLAVPYGNQGKSFAPLICEGNGRGYSEREYVFAENVIPEVINDGKKDFRYIRGQGIRGIRHPDAKMIRSRRWKYVYYVDYEELFDLESDPGETTDVSDEGKYADIIGKLRKELLDWMITADEADQIAPSWFQVRNKDGDWVSWVDREKNDL